MAARAWLAVVMVAATTAAVAAQGTADQENTPFIDGLSGPSECPAFQCDKGLEAVPQRPLRLTGTGCSTMGGMQMFSANSGPGEGALEACCNQRHACFQTCGSSRKACERGFKQCTRQTCAALPPGKDQNDCETSAKMHNMMSGLQDCRDFISAQTSACQCLTPEKAATRREKLLTDFYKKFNPDKLSQVPSLVAKAGDGARKFAGLISQLVAKYPAAVKGLKDPTQEAMERFMKQARAQETGGDGAAAKGKSRRGKGKGGVDEEADGYEEADSMRQYENEEEL